MFVNSWTMKSVNLVACMIVTAFVLNLTLVYFSVQFANIGANIAIHNALYNFPVISDYIFTLGPVINSVTTQFVLIICLHKTTHCYHTTIMYL